MSAFDDEPKPGTALKIVVEENAQLNAFVAMIERKLQLDKQRVNDLKEWQQSWNPEWTTSGIAALVTPLLDHMKQEVAYYEASNEEITSIIKNLSTMDVAVNTNDNDEFSPLDIPDNLINLYLDIGKAGVKRPYWPRVYERGRQLRLPSLRGPLPLIDRQHRSAVSRQQRAVEVANEWYDSHMNGILENHQQRAEDVKACVHKMLASYSDIYLSLSKGCSSNIHAIAEFASTSFIAHRHEEVEKEKTHIILTKAKYWCWPPYYGFVQPLVGLGPEGTISLMNSILSFVFPTTEVFLGKSLEDDERLKPAFELEKNCLDKELDTALIQGGRYGTFRLITAIFWSDEPLIPLLEADVDQFKGGISRSKMRPLLLRLLPDHRAGILNMMFRFVDFCMHLWPAPDATFPQVSNAMTHNGVSSNIVKSIWRKWDTANDCPLPLGVERVFNESKRISETIWLKTGEIYVPDSSLLQKRQSGHSPTRRLIRPTPLVRNVTK